MFCVPHLFGLLTRMNPLIITPQARTSSCHSSGFTAPGLTLPGRLRACEPQMQVTQNKGSWHYVKLRLRPRNAEQHRAADIPLGPLTLASNLQLQRI